jgi:hypothetical protein
MDKDKLPKETETEGKIEGCAEACSWKWKTGISDDPDRGFTLALYCIELIIRRRLNDTNATGLELILPFCVEAKNNDKAVYSFKCTCKVRDMQNNIELGWWPEALTVARQHVKAYLVQFGAFGPMFLSYWLLYHMTLGRSLSQRSVPSGR